MSQQIQPTQLIDQSFKQYQSVVYDLIIIALREMNDEQTAIKVETQLLESRKCHKSIIEILLQPKEVIAENE